MCCAAYRQKFGQSLNDSQHKSLNPIHSLLNFIKIILREKMFDDFVLLA